MIVCACGAMGWLLVVVGRYRAQLDIPFSPSRVFASHELFKSGSGVHHVTRGVLKRGVPTRCVLKAVSLCDVLAAHTQLTETVSSCCTAVYAQSHTHTHIYRYMYIYIYKRCNYTYTDTYTYTCT